MANSCSLRNRFIPSGSSSIPLSSYLVLQEAKKKMSPTNARALNAMRQRLKKHNINYQEQIKAFRCPRCLSGPMLGCAGLYASLVDFCCSGTPTLQLIPHRPRATHHFAGWLGGRSHYRSP